MLGWLVEGGTAIVVNAEVLEPMVAGVVAWVETAAVVIGAASTGCVAGAVVDTSSDGSPVSGMTRMLVGCTLGVVDTGSTG